MPSTRSRRRPAAAPASAPAAPPSGALAPPIAALTVFLASGAVLMLEILAVRLLAPYVGLTLETTTSIIGAVLAGIALGAWVGGSVADRTEPRRLAVGLLIVGGLLALLTVPIVRWLGPGARGHGNLAALGVTLASLVPSAAVLSAISPTIARIQLRDLGASGATVGHLSAYATAGALVGTFGTGFVLVPLVPVSTAVLIIGVSLGVYGLLLGGYLRALGPPVMAAALVALVGLGTLSATRDSPCDADTTYHCASIVLDAQDPDGRELMLDGVSNSFVDLKDKTQLEFPYTAWIARAIDDVKAPPAALDAVFVGGGAFTLPQLLVATRPGSHVRVLEVDGKLVDLDREKLGLRTSEALKAVVGDARVSMRDVPSHSADVVVGDAFSGYTVPWQLLTREYNDEVRRVLKPGGLYIINLIDLERMHLARAVVATLRRQFRDVQMAAVPDAAGDVSGESGNLEILSSDAPRTWRGFDPDENGAAVFDRDAMARFSKGGKLLRDDYAPVDQLLTIKPPPSS
ncbi:MAG TPA: fused MFS/spermidine synthase [Baekduia sp.]|uniref:fused MFS/spermidine synthase n=1 Tax=Baekduia sp. TaxID=2600305 RepID=UPI002D794E6C|nr:fused MFS/spermidine synthase [Baekduia sp.]HET6509465.1 fused MFS/spermidine synthase [Baekduia sp.]